MRQLPLDYIAESCAMWFTKMMHNKGIRKKAKTEIGNLLSKFPDGAEVKVIIDKNNTFIYRNNEYREYLNNLLKEYDGLSTIHPRNFYKKIRLFENIIPSDHINCKIEVGGNCMESLSKQLVAAMQYDDVRSKVYPRIARKLELKSCVYCNANYTISADNNQGFYDLDHWMPKSYYPYFCVSFFNLQPCCAPCNKRKGNDKAHSYFHLWDDKGLKNRTLLGIRLKRGCVANYLVNHNRNVLEPEFFATETRYKGMRDEAEKRFRIVARYREHLDCAEEIIWKSQAYNASYMKNLRASIKMIVPTDADVNRFILGTYGAPDDIHKRPLTAFAQSIGRSMGLIK